MGQRMLAAIETECGHCRETIRLETDGAHHARVLEGGPAPLVFAPHAYSRRTDAPSIIDGF